MIVHAVWCMVSMVVFNGMGGSLLFVGIGCRVVGSILALQQGLHLLRLFLHQPPPQHKNQHPDQEQAPHDPQHNKKHRMIARLFACVSGLFKMVTLEARDALSGRLTLGTSNHEG
jgi:hypothetical protein